VIGFLRGTLVAKKAPSLVLDVGGVGYEVDVPMSTFFKLPAVGEALILHTHLAVREDAHSLYGFITEAERSLFRTLIKVTGVGAKLALGVLSGIGVDEFHRCVRANNVARLVRLPGIGKKTAERLVIELRDRLPAGIEGGDASGPDVMSPSGEESPAEEAVSALAALGFKPADAAAMVKRIPAAGKSSEDLIRLALQGADKK
jgi:holliday junction DNA helicase RuvA